MHYYKILKHKAGFDEGTSYWEKLLARYLAATGGGKIHATLPITFTSTSWKLASWTIYGNNTPHNYSAEGTLPLTFSTHTAGNADDWTIYGNDLTGENLFDWSTITVGQAFTSVGDIITGLGNNWATSEYMGVQPDQQYYIPAVTTSMPKTMVYHVWYDANKDVISTVAVSINDVVLRSPLNAKYLRISIRQDRIDVSTYMITKGSTAPDHFIPHQQGVGERTKNLFDFQQFADGTQTTTNGGLTFTRDNDTIVINNSSTSVYPEVYLNSDDGSNVPALEAATYNVQLYAENAPQDAVIYVDIYGKNTLDDSWHYINLIKPQNRNITISTTYAYYSYLLIAKGRGITYSNTKVRIQIIKGNTAPSSYIPYGYEIPISVNGTPQTFYIGSSPLTAGQSISKTSTGVDIAAIAGSNTITTELYNKPEMSIEGVDYVGVGERTKNLLPFTNGTKTSNNVSAICVNGSYIVSIGEGETAFTELSFDIPPVTFPISVGAGGMGVLSLFNTAKTGASICFKNSGTIVQRFELNSENRIFDDYTNLGGATINRISFRIQANTAAGSLTIKPILTDDRTTPPSYIPYGYEIPLTVSQTGQTDKSYDIYIGDSPLTEGQTVSDTTEIEVFEGENTIDTTLYNKPEMEITYE